MSSDGKGFYNPHNIVSIFYITIWGLGGGVITAKFIFYLEIIINAGFKLTQASIFICINNFTKYP